MGGGKKSILILLSVLISFVAFCFINDIDGGYFSFMRTFQFFPFFIIGHCLTLENIAMLQYKKSALILSFFFIVIVVLTCHIAGPEYNAILFSKYGIKDLQNIIGLPAVTTLGIRYMVFLISLLVCFFFLSIFRCPTWFSENGNTTLFILCTHVVIYYLARQISSSVIAFTIALLSIILLTRLAKSKFSQWFIYPFSSIRTLFN